MNENPEIAKLQIQTRSSKLQYIDMCQFNLSYLAHIDFETTNEMSVAEFNNVYNILLKVKEEERQAQEKALAEAKARSGKR